MLLSLVCIAAAAAAAAATVAAMEDGVLVATEDATAIEQKTSEMTASRCGVAGAQLNCYEQETTVWTAKIANAFDKHDTSKKSNFKKKKKK